MAQQIYLINREKFLGELKKRNLTMADIAKEMGFSDKYISNKVRENRGFTKGDITLLQSLFNISYDSYKKEMPQPVEKKEQTLISDGNNDIEEMIYRAVSRAIKDNLKQNYLW